MPEYKFACRQCGKHFTAKQSFEEHDQHKHMKCPKCGSRKVEQAIVATFVKTSKKS